MVLGPGNTVMSKRNVVPAFMACEKDVTGQMGKIGRKQVTQKIPILSSRSMPAPSTFPILPFSMSANQRWPNRPGWEILLNV